MPQTIEAVEPAEAEIMPADTMPEEMPTPEEWAEINRVAEVINHRLDRINDTLHAIAGELRGTSRAIADALSINGPKANGTASNDSNGATPQAEQNGQ